MEPRTFSDREYSNRVSNLNSILSSLDAAVIFSRADLYYYSSIGMDGALFWENGEVRHLIRRNVRLAEGESIFPVEHFPSYRKLKELGESRKVEKIGLELDLLPWKTVAYINKAFGNPEIVDISNELRMIRSVKSTEEIRVMEESCAQTDESFALAQEIIKPGISELEISAAIEEKLRVSGHPGWVQVRMFHHNLTNLSFVMAGESVSTLNSTFGPLSGQGVDRMHTNGSSRRKLKQGDAVVIDTTGVVDGYISDVTRTFFLGTVSQQLVDAHEIANDVQNVAGSLFRPNSHPGEIYESLIDIVSEAGYLDHFMGIHSDTVKFIGHGIGIELDEFPIITPGYKNVLQKGNTIALEPKFVFEDGGVGIEESWVVGENGGRRMSKFPNGLRI